MTFVKVNPFAPNVAFKNLNTLDKMIHEVLNTPIFNDDFRVGKTNPSVNVLESADAFKIEVAAPGLSKEDFKISVENDTLTIWAEKAEKKSETAEDAPVKADKYLRREFNFNAFKRSFTLPENVGVEGIKAAYTEGVLNVTIPKVEVKKTTQSIEIQ